ncbi:MAG: DUF3465 domain-containing protein [Thiogranum sp.]|jgi:hypothetical protein|nr:DUF3465 domain-containing protein [Thiogranum sp.]
MKKTALLIVVVFSLYGYLEKNPDFIQSFANQSATDDSVLSSAYQNRKSDIQVSGTGVVIRNLTDDTSGSRHQKFILKLSSGQTLLISHNIDLAPRINSLRKGDAVDFYGEYEWNSKGGLVHWTHHDPRGNHIGGWLKHNSATYQ